MGTPARAVGIVGLVLGIAATELGILVYQAWWTIVFAIAGVVVVYFAPRNRAVATVAIGVSAAFFLAVTVLGAFLLVMSLYAGGAACAVDCSDPRPGFLIAGLLALAVGVLGLLFTLRYALRSNPSPKVEPPNS